MLKLMQINRTFNGGENGDEKAKSELQTRFSGRLQFGTAGLRGPLQAGPYGYEPCFSGTGSRWFSGLFKDMTNSLLS